MKILIFGKHFLGVGNFFWQKNFSGKFFFRKKIVFFKKKIFGEHFFGGKIFFFGEIFFFVVILFFHRKIFFSQIKFHQKKIPKKIFTENIFLEKQKLCWKIKFSWKIFSPKNISQKKLKIIQGALNLIGLAQHKIA